MSDEEEYEYEYDDDMDEDNFEYTDEEVSENIRLCVDLRTLFCCCLVSFLTDLLS